MATIDVSANTYPYPYYQGNPLELLFSFTATGDVYYSVMWGDGTSYYGSVTVGGLTHIVLWHVYYANTSYNIRVTVWQGSSTGSAGAFVYANSIAPTITVAGGQLNNKTGWVDVNYTFTDTDTSATYTSVITWGDGSSHHLPLSSPGTYINSHLYSSYASDSSYRRLITIKITRNDNKYDVSSFYPVTTYYDNVDDVAEGAADWYGVVKYHDTIDDIAACAVVVDGIPFYFPDADGTAESDLRAVAHIDHASVFVVGLDIQCKPTNIPFEELIPPE